jgi:hypothetical protein
VLQEAELAITEPKAVHLLYESSNDSHSSTVDCLGELS